MARRHASLLLLCLVAACTENAAAPKPVTVATPPAQVFSAPGSAMSAAEAAAREGRFADAGRLAEQVIQSGQYGQNDVVLAMAFTGLAKDPAAGARVRETAFAAGKLDWTSATRVPMLYREAGDEANAVRATDQLKQQWQTRPERARTPPPAAMLALERFKVGDYNVFALECLEQTGRFRIGRIFNIDAQPDGKPLKGEDVLMRIVVEHETFTAQAMKDLGKGDGTPKPTLDGFVGDMHMTLAYFEVEPSYADLRARISGYLQAKPAIPKPFGKGSWAGLACGS